MPPQQEEAAEGEHPVLDEPVADALGHRRRHLHHGGHVLRGLAKELPADVRFAGHDAEGRPQAHSRS
eukprot:4463931-Lingulodinium_polyedra.AAC.1